MKTAKSKNFHLNPAAWSLIRWASFPGEICSEGQPTSGNLQLAQDRARKPETQRRPLVLGSVKMSDSFNAERGIVSLTHSSSFYVPPSLILA